MTTRETKRYWNENGAEVNVHEVTEDTAGGVHLTGVGNQDVRPGDLLVQDNANSWTKVNSLEGLTAEDDETAEAASDDFYESNRVESERGTYDPSQHTVDEVNAYLYDNAHYTDEVERVVAAERKGKNRTGIVSGR